ncbi:MAG: hypothetical protein WCE79_08010 [Xanthobacteraceae bacterium]
MPLQNRVTPFGELIATAERGTMFGNRGGRFHRDDGTLGARRWASRQWICCVLAFKGRRHDVWGRGYTDLFFLDEATALAAGHRPCFECRRRDARSFAAKWAEAKGTDFPYVDEMDRVLQAERLDGRDKRTHEMDFDALPEGAFIAAEDHAYAVRGTHLLRWSENGYVGKIARPPGTASVLTPPSIVAVLSAGYQPQWHPSAERAVYP